MQQDVSDYEGPALRESVEANADAEGIIRQEGEQSLQDVDQTSGTTDGG